MSSCCDIFGKNGAHCEAQVCVIGAGKMSRLLFKHMAAKGCTSAVLLNRSLPRAQALAEEFPEVTPPSPPLPHTHSSAETCIHPPTNLLPFFCL